jgi:hypothetical protein
MSVILQNLCQIQHAWFSLRYVNYGHRHIQCSCNSAHSGFNIRLNVSALPLEISVQFNAGYTTNLVPNLALILQFSLCAMWSRPYTKYLQLRIFRLQYSTDCICAAIGDIAKIQFALLCNLGAKYSAHHPVYAMWTMVRHIYNVITAPHIQASIFNWTYLLGYWRYAGICMPVILQMWCHI